MLFVKLRLERLFLKLLFIKPDKLSKPVSVKLSLGLLSKAQLVATALKPELEPEPELTASLASRCVSTMG